MRQIPMTADEPVPVRYRIWWTICAWPGNACKLLTRHRQRKLEAFWNYKPPTRKRDIERLERWRRQEARHD